MSLFSRATESSEDVGTAARGGRRRRFALLPVGELSPAENARLFRRSAVCVLAGALVFAVLYGVLSWLKYRAYMDARFDLGNMAQAVYNTAHGRFLEITTGEAVPRQMSRLGSHVDPILALFAVPWLVWPSPVMLLVLQSVIVATGAWPVFRLGAGVTRDPRAGALLAGAYLLYPATGFLVLNEFHPVALATPLLIWAFLYMEEDRWVRAGAFLLLAALCKETVPLVIGVMGAYFALRKRSWRPLIVTALAGAYFAGAVWVVIPHFNQSQSAFIARYGEYGEGSGQVIRTMLSDPVRTIGDVLAVANLTYWLRLLWPFGFLPLMSPVTTLVAAPELMLNALSATPYQRRIEFHYSALAIPFLTVGTVFGLMRLWRWLGGGFRRAGGAMTGERVRRTTLAALVMVFALAGNYFLGPLPFPGSTYGGYYAQKAHSTALEEAVHLIPDDARVSVNNNAGAQLAARRVAYVFPYYEDAEWVLIDERHPFVYDRENAAVHAQALRSLMLDDRYHSVFSMDGVHVFKRTVPLGD
ncbi:MAG TPA: DUF2079 domain-containing protein [Thermoleophilia bacterium]|nr:DUF2079 domain-containing protein [Thermoleophilia bacterium]